MTALSDLRGTQPRQRRRAAAAAATGVAALLALTLTACGGSALAPEAVRAANAKLLGQSTGAVAGSGTGTNTDVGTSAGSTGGGGTTSDGTTGGTDSGSTGGTGSTGSGSNGSGSTGGSGSGAAGNPGTASGGSGTVVGVAAPATGSGVKAGSCAGFKNSTGITSSTITLGNVADISGPVPGIFTAAAYAVKAYAKYFNSTSSICGRKLSVLSLDSQTNAGAENVATQKVCDQTFAAIGSMSAFDSGGTSTVKRCGIPDVHAVVTNDSRATAPNTFGTQAPGGGYFANAIPDFFTKRNKAATQKAAMLYVNAAASVGGAKGQVKAETRRGWKFVYTSPFDIAEFNYAPYVQRMKQAGVRLVQMYGSADMAVRMAQAMQTANFKPDFFVMNATQYDPTFAKAGSAVEGSILYIDFAPIEDMARNPELRLYNTWLQQVSPGARPTYFGAYAWSAARLFAEQATALGGKLTRANLLARIRAVNSWTSNGLHSPQDVGAKKTSRCWRFIQLHNGVWRPYGGSAYQCGGRTSSR